jgi:ubiquinone/menaquinone biosynthesis C-methylase UbiE
MSMYEWSEEMCRSYAEDLRPIIRLDHAVWAQKIAARLVGLPVGATVLDVATGPGFLLVETARRIPGLRLIAQDQMKPMLEIARTELERAGFSAEAVCCPAEELQLADASVDVVLCKQFLHEAGDVDLALGEMWRVLKPGGRAFIIDFDADGSRLAAFAVRTFLRATRGRAIAHNFWRSFKAGLRGTQLRDRLLKAGFTDAEYVRSGFNYLLQGTKASVSCQQVCSRS